MHALIFAAVDHKWLEFVMANRRDPFFAHEYDLVAGPVANDRVFATLTLFEMNAIGVEETLARLKTYTLIDQYLFHTEKALSCLRFLKAEEVT